MRKKGDDFMPSSSLLLGLAVLLLWVANVMGQTTPSSTETTRLRIAVPVKLGYTGFVKTTVNAVNGNKDFSGFCIDVFKTVVDKVMLPGGIEYEFIQYAKPDGTMNGTYNDMLKAVFSKDYDGAVGDITIRFERTDWVDFTMPYTDSGVAMLVPMGQSSSTTKAGISLLPLVKGLLIGALALFVFTALLFSTLDYINKNSGQPQAQGLNVRKTEDDRLRETLRAIRDTRVVMVLWFVVLLLLTTCYTASLTSLVTTQQARVPTKNLNQLLRNGDNVGYSRGSFVYGYLTEKGFREKNLIAFDTEQEVKDLLSKGTANGGVAAVIHETPYLQTFLAKHCNEYALVPNFNIQAAGFGFAFQRGSRWVQPISDGILKLLDNGQLAKIQDRNVGSLASCQGDTGGGSSSDVVNSGILIAGIVCCLFIVLILYAVYISTKCNRARQKVVNHRVINT